MLPIAFLAFNSLNRLLNAQVSVYFSLGVKLKEKILIGLEIPILCDADALIIEWTSFSDHIKSE